MASAILKKLINNNASCKRMSGASGALGGNLFSKFAQFKREIEESGRDPNEILEELVASGKVTQSQINQAKRLASLYHGKFGV